MESGLMLGKQSSIWWWSIQCKEKLIHWLTKNPFLTSQICLVPHSWKEVHNAQSSPHKPADIHWLQGIIRHWTVGVINMLPHSQLTLMWPIHAIMLKKKLAPLRFSFFLPNLQAVLSSLFYGLKIDFEKLLENKIIHFLEVLDQKPSMPLPAASCLFSYSEKKNINQQRGNTR